jgi:hypothetical protein
MKKEMVKYQRRLRTMARVEELANEIQQLNRQELAAFRDWFHKYDSDAWDREIEEDVLAGRLDKLASEAIAEHRAGRTKEL